VRPVALAQQVIRAINLAPVSGDEFRPLQKQQRPDFRSSRCHETPLEAPRELKKLTAPASKRGARARHYSFVFFFFFDFLAMACFPSGVKNVTAGLVKLRGRVSSVPGGFAPLPPARMPQAACGCNPKIENNPDFSVA